MESELRRSNRGKHTKSLTLPGEETLVTPKRSSQSSVKDTLATSKRALQSEVDIAHSRNHLPHS